MSKHTVPNNGVTRMPIAAQRAELDDLELQVAVLDQRLMVLRHTCAKRRAWIEAQEATND